MFALNNKGDSNLLQELGKNQHSLSYQNIYREFFRRDILLNTTQETESFLKQI